MKTQLSILLLVVFISASSQDYIKNDFMITENYIYNPELYFNPNEDAILLEYFHLIPLAQSFLPIGKDTTVQPSGWLSNYMACTYFAENKLAFLWYYLDVSNSNYYVKIQVFDSNGDSIAPSLFLSSNTTGYQYKGFAAKQPDKDGDLGFAWSTYDTLYAVFFNTQKQELSEKKTLLTGTGLQNLQVVDFQNNGNIRIIWRDVNGNIRHKKYTKSGEVAVNESVLFGLGTITYDARMLRYSSITNGMFLICELHQNPETYNYGIETRKYNDDGILIKGPSWSIDSISNPSGDFEKIFQASMQEDGKAAIVWKDLFWDDKSNNFISFLSMQLLDTVMNKCGGNFRPTTINDESNNKAYLVYQSNPYVRLNNDTIILVWLNENQELSFNYQVFMNIQKFTKPKISAISSFTEIELKHWYTFNDKTGERLLMVESPLAIDAHLKIIDGLGRCVGAISNIQLQPGQNTISLDKNILNYGNNHGFYIYNIEINKEQFTGKIYY